MMYNHLARCIFVDILVLFTNAFYAFLLFYYYNHMYTTNFGTLSWGSESCNKQKVSELILAGFQWTCDYKIYSDAFTMVYEPL